MPKYKLEVWHVKPYYRKGNLEFATEEVAGKTFPTRKEANRFLTNKASYAKDENMKYNIELISRGDSPSRLTVFTGFSWTNENSGEKIQEQYQYIINKSL